MPVTQEPGLEARATLRKKRMQKDVDLRQLEIFAAIAEAGSFSGAARTLYLTQPTVSEHIANLEGVDMVEVIGMPHRLFDDGVFAFVKPRMGAELTPQTVMEHCRAIASYKRPQHVEIWPVEKDLPLTRSTKVDKLALQQLAAPVIEELRAQGGWDAQAREPSQESQ